MAEPAARIVPNFFVVGTQKAGTTFLCEHLRAHEKVAFGKRKELFFFGKAGLEDKDFQRYLKRYFPPRRTKKGATVIAEGTANYFQSRHALKNMNRFLGNDFKAIVSLRDPVTKTISWYLHNYRRGRFDSSHSILDPHLIRRARHAPYLRRWLKSLGPERFMPITYDTLKEDPRAFVNGALDFLGLEPVVDLPSSRINKGYRIVRRGDFIEPLFNGHTARTWDVPRFAIQDVARLHDLMRDDIKRTQSLTGLDLTRWLEMPQFATVDALTKKKPSLVGRVKRRAAKLFRF
jgi:hypothetical protein